MTAGAGRAPRVIARLRAATSAAHAGLDQHGVLAPLGRPDVTTREAGAALSALHGPQRALEEALAVGLARFHPGYPFAPRLPDLEGDLGELGLTPQPLVDALAVPLDADTTLGMLYVFEGARLGGAVIARRLPRDRRWRFFAGGAPREAWGRFVAHCADRDAETRDTRAIEGALAAFDLVHRHLDRVGAQPPVSL